MLPSQNNIISTSLSGIKLEDFGALEGRYQSMKLALRAGAVINDSAPALAASERILAELMANPATPKAIGVLRQNSLLITKMRPSEAKNILTDSANDYMQVARNKLTAWRKTMERVAQGEAIVVENNKEYISGNSPLAMAMVGTAGIGTYLSVVQLVIAEMAKIDAANGSQYNVYLAEIRRCSTLLSDCEHASRLGTLIH